jgi:hypothetical protein
LWYSDNSSLNTRLTALNSDLASAQRERDAAKDEARHPTLGINNTTQTIQANSGWIAGGVPDTFTYHLAFISDVAVTYVFVSYHDYVTFATCNTSAFTMNDRSRSKLGGCLYNLGGRYAQGSSNLDDSVWGGGTNVSMTFHGAEGCAGWTSIMFPSKANEIAHVTPNISITYNPSSVATPPCA